MNGLEQKHVLYTGYSVIRCNLMCYACITMIGYNLLKDDWLRLKEYEFKLVAYEMYCNLHTNINLQYMSTY